MVSGSTPVRRPWALASAVLGFAMVAIYVTLILTQGGVSWFQFLPWALLMAIGAVGSAIAAYIDDRRLARRLLVGVTALFAALGAVSILSIGIGFLMTAAVAAVAALRLTHSR